MFNGLHYEGVTVTTWDGALIQAHDVGNTAVNVLHAQSVTFGAGQNNKSVAKVGLNARMRIHGLSPGNANTNNSAVFGMMQSIDQTGAFTATDATTGL